MSAHRGLPNDQCRRDSDAAVRRAVLSGLPDGQRHRQAGPVRGAQLQRADTGRCAGGEEGRSQSKINWDLLERRIASNEKAYQRQIIRKKIEELVQYYEQCRQARDLPSIPGAVIISCDEKLSFEPVEGGLPRRHG